MDTAPRIITEIRTQLQHYANKNTHIYSENVVLVVLVVPSNVIVCFKKDTLRIVEQVGVTKVVPNSEFGTTEEEKMKRAVGKKELLTIVPLSLSTIYRLEKNGEFPKRWYITDGRCA
jgi:prophage regulatory protein